MARSSQRRRRSAARNRCAWRTQLVGRSPSRRPRHSLGRRLRRLALSVRAHEPRAGRGTRMEPRPGLLPRSRAGLPVPVPGGNLMRVWVHQDLCTGDGLCTDHQPSLIRRLLADPKPVLDELSACYGPMCGFGSGPLRMAVVGDPAALRELSALPTDHFRWGHKFKRVEGPGRHRVGAVRPRRPQLHRVRPRSDGTHAHHRPHRQRLDITSTASEIPRPVGMVVNRRAGGPPMRVSGR